MDNKKIIAMWSGPRNLSTALMYSFENRGDTKIEDEPFYGYFLSNNEIIHPERDVIINIMETDKCKLISYLSDIENLKNERIWYQKQMTHHININDYISWIKHITNCFLIRNPIEVISSYKKIYSEVSMNLIGLEQQNKIFDYVLNNINDKPLVIDAYDLRNNPESILKKACQKLNINFTKKMLHWPEGPKKNEGVWGKFWYQNVWNTTSFIKQKNNHNKKVPLNIKKLYEQAKIFYDKLYYYKINP